IGDEMISSPTKILVFSDHLQDVVGDEDLHPEKATLLGASRTIPREYPNVTCRSVDLRLDDGTECAGLADCVLAEMATNASEETVAYRQNRRWVQVLEPLRLDDNALGMPVREHGVYMITGGFGGIRFTLAEHLARSARIKLILVSRTALPPREQWPERIRTDGNNQAVSKIKKLLKLEELRAEVMAVRADVADEVQMRDAWNSACSRF